MLVACVVEHPAQLRMMTVANNGCFTARVEQPHCLLGMGSFSCVNLDGNVRRVGCCFAVVAKMPSTNPRVGTLVGVRRPSASPRKKASPKKLGMSGWMFFRVVETTRSGVKVCSIEDHSTHVFDLSRLRLVDLESVFFHNVPYGMKTSDVVAQAISASQMHWMQRASAAQETLQTTKKSLFDAKLQKATATADRDKLRRERDALVTQLRRERKEKDAQKASVIQLQAEVERLRVVAARAQAAHPDVSRLFGGGVVGSRGGGVAAL